MGNKAGEAYPIYGYIDYNSSPSSAYITAKCIKKAKNLKLVITASVGSNNKK
jgi:lactate dehydrogenase-like 2-hydroxyacid dehydrogenase